MKLNRSRSRWKCRDRLAPVGISEHPDLLKTKLGVNPMHCILIIFVMIVFNLAQASEAVADFSRYPRTEPFVTYLRIHTDAVDNVQWTNFLAISSFPNGDINDLQYLVSASGEEMYSNLEGNFALQILFSKRLSEADLKHLRSALKTLPSKNATPPIERLIIVSFREGTNWITHTYDRDTPPSQMRKVYEIIEPKLVNKSDK
jgi:hypothetical protein